MLTPGLIKVEKVKEIFSAATVNCVDMTRLELTMLSDKNRVIWVLFEKKPLTRPCKPHVHIRSCICENGRVLYGQSTAGVFLYLKHKSHFSSKAG